MQRWSLKLKTYLFSGKYYARLIGFGLITVCVPIVQASFFAYTIVTRNPLKEQVQRANLPISIS